MVNYDTYPIFFSIKLIVHICKTDMFSFMDFSYILGGSDSTDLQCHLGVCDYVNPTIDSDVPQLKRATIFENIIHYVIWFPNLCNTGYAILRSMDFYRFWSDSENS